MLFKYSLGLDINLPSNLINYDSYNPLLQSWCFGEDQARIIIATKDINKVQLILKENDVDFFVLGQTNSSGNLNLKDIDTISINEIKDINEKTIPSMMGDELQG
jgi:phosphoribosylformylglycinamidine (FGAM) synthase-like enzyme